MNKALNKRRFLFLWYVSLVILLGFLVHAAEKTEKTPLASFLAMPNPTVADLLRLHEQSGESFAHIEAWNKLDSGEQAAFLETHYIQEYAEYAVLHSAFNPLRPDKQEQQIADIYFSRGAANINAHLPQFENFLISHGVDILVSGPLKKYEAGRIVGANGELNVHAVKQQYALRVQPDGKIYLARKPKKKGGPVSLHSFEGVITLNQNGQLRMKQGRFDSHVVDGVEELHIDEQDRVKVQARAFGPFVFDKPRLMLFLKGSGSMPDRFRMMRDTVVNGLPYHVGGTFALARSGSLADGLIVMPGDEASVGGYEIHGLDANVHLRFGGDAGDALRQKAKKANEVLFAEDGSVAMTSAGRNAYEIKTDPASVLRQRNPQDLYPTFLDMGAREQFKQGDRFASGDAFVQFATIQSIVGDDQTGVFSPYTRQKVIEWQNAYNRRHGLRSGSDGWLEPHGRWTQAESDAFFVELNDAAHQFFRPQGGSAVVRPGTQGVDIKLYGDVDFVGDTATYSYASKKILRRQVPISVVTAPFSLTAYDEAGKKILEMRQNAHVSYSGSRKTSRTEVLSPVNQGIVSGETCLPCQMLREMGADALRQSRCAEFVQRVTVQEGGGITRRYGKNEAFNSYIGVYGSAWEMSHNIRSHGGETLFWKEQERSLNPGDAQLREPVAYDFGSMQEGDVIGMYFANSGYLDEAAAQGVDGRKNTHVGKIVGTKQEVYTPPAGGSLSAFLKSQLGVSNPAILRNYPVWVKKADDAPYTPVRLGSDENYYDAATGASISASAVSSVMVQKTIVAHLIGHGQSDAKDAVRVEDIGRFFDGHPSFSLYEHLRPNQNRLAEAYGAKPSPARQAVSPSSSSTPSSLPTAEDYLLALYLPKQGSARLEKKLRVAQTIKTSAPRDVLVVSSPAPLTEQPAAPTSTLVENMETAGVSDPSEWVRIVEQSTRERLQEYGISSSDAEALKALTLAVGIKESGLTDSPLGMHKLKRYGENVFAYVPQALSPSQGYGYYELHYENAERNARELAAAGKIPAADYESRRDLLSREGSVRHGQRQLAKIWKRYLTPDMPVQDKVALVGAAYNCGEWCPRNAAVQQQLNDVTGTSIPPTGRFRKDSVAALADYARERGVPFDPSRLGEEFDYAPVFRQLKSEWEQASGIPAPYGITPHWGYGSDVLTLCRTLSPACNEERELSAAP